MESLRDSLSTVLGRIKRYKGTRRINEENTKATLIEPVLRALGWAVEDLDEVQREFKVKRRDKPVDYALLDRRDPRLFIEAKALGENLQDRRWTNQIMGYAGVAGVEWIVLTDGDEYRIYNAHAAVAVDEKLIRATRLTEDFETTLETLSLLTKERMSENRLEALWKAQFVDRQVRAAVEGLFAADPDPSAVRLICKRTRDLSPRDVRASLGRMQFSVEFPVEIPRPTASVRKPPKKERTATARKVSGDPKHSISIEQLLGSGVLQAPVDLERTYKGKEFYATLQPDGTVVFDGATFNSVSTAAGAARATIIGTRSNGRVPQTNGWTFWKVRGGDGSLDSYRERLVQSGGVARGPLRVLRGNG